MYWWFTMFSVSTEEDLHSWGSAMSPNKYFSSFWRSRSVIYLVCSLTVYYKNSLFSQACFNLQISVHRICCPLCVCTDVAASRIDLVYLVLKLLETSKDIANFVGSLRQRMLSTYRQFYWSKNWRLYYCLFKVLFP